jgi:excisionase family DNA binding protein
MVHMPQIEQITVSQAAKIIGCSRWTVVRLLNTGELKGHKTGDGTTPWLIARKEAEREAAKRAKGAVA